MTRDEIAAASEDDLKELLAAHGAPTDGTRDELAERLEKVLFIDDTPKEVQGGAVVEQKTVTPVTTPAEGADIEVITKQPGTLSKAGIIKANSRIMVTADQYSSAWMSPADEASAKKVEKVLAAREKAAKAKAKADAK